MGRPRQREQLRDVVVASRFTKDEAALIDASRGSLNRAEWLRWVALRAVRAQSPTGDAPETPV